ncbi:MAG TPA: hypothetical protein VNO30_12185 [Kofleriaceae bacterium]|nr:hypothetical protein [Kofleriaceae bacterium]
MKTRFVELLVASAAISLLSSCSFGMRSLPSDWNPHQPPRCTQSTVAPLVDTAAAVPLTLLGPIMTLSALTSSCEDEECYGVALAGLFSIPITLIDLIYVSSAVHGYRVADKCSNAHKTHQQALQRDADEARRLGARSP